MMNGMGLDGSLFSGAADIDVDSLWACVSNETLRRTTDLARRVFNAPRAILSSFTSDQQIIRWSSEDSETGGAIAMPYSLCNHVILSGRAIAAPVVAEHAAFAGIRPVHATKGYLGSPLRLAQGRIMGTLCVSDTAPRAWRGEDLDILAMLAAGITNEVDLRLEIMRRDSATERTHRDVYLPTRDPLFHESAVLTAEIPATPWPPIEPQAVNGARILLADDLDLNRKLIADMLAYEGHAVDCVADGAAAVQAAREKIYDLILMDMIMPVMDGTAATRAIRALPEPACRVPIVALTAHSFREQLDACLAAGMNGTLTKPLSMATLTGAVDEWTSGRTKAA